MYNTNLTKQEQDIIDILSNYKGVYLIEQKKGIYAYTAFAVGGCLIIHLTKNTVKTLVRKGYLISIDNAEFKLNYEFIH